MQIKNLFEDILYRIRNREYIYINAYVGRYGNNTPKNWGDDINYWFLRDIIKQPLRLYNESPIAFRKCDDNYLVIGSTLSLLTKPTSIVWGAGCISDKIKLPAIPKKVLAVRGPLTKAFLNNQGIECPEVYGDPALLLPLYYKPTASLKKHTVGLIQHVSEVKIDIPGCHNISMSNYKHWTDIIDEICSCEVIASSSLHGLIVAEAYGIPNVWIESKELLGGRFKFHDFFLSIGRDRDKPLDIRKIKKIREFINRAVQPVASGFDLLPLLNACPFELCPPLR